MKRFLLPIALAAVSLRLLGCSFHGDQYGDGAWRIDGVDLEHRRAVEFEVSSWHANGLEVDLRAGSLEVRAGDEGPDRVRLEVLEFSPGDASVSYRDGELVVESASGQPCAITNVVVSCSSALNALQLANGMGSVRVADLTVSGDCHIDAGMDDVHLSALAVGGELHIDAGMGSVQLSETQVADDVEFDVGMGSLTASDSRFADASIEAGQGSVTFARVSAQDADLEVGMGSIELNDCSFDDLSAEAGMGNITATNLECEAPHLEAGMGQVHVR